MPAELLRKYDNLKSTCTRKTWKNRALGQSFRLNQAIRLITVVKTFYIDFLENLSTIKIFPMKDLNRKSTFFCVSNLRFVSNFKCTFC